MPETPHTPTEDAETPRPSETMMDFAEREGRDFLAAYINHTKERYLSEGVTVDNFCYFPALYTEPSKVEIQYTPIRSQEGHESITHGGISLFMIDSSSGAFAMSAGKPDQVAITDEHRDVIFSGSVRTGIPTRVVSREATERELKKEDMNQGLNKRQILVYTDVIQGGKVRVTAKTICTLLTKKSLDRTRRSRSDTIN